MNDKPQLVDDHWRVAAYLDARARLETQKESIWPMVACLSLAALGGFLLGVML